MGHQHGSGGRPERTQIVQLYTDPPPDTAVIGVDALGPVSPRTCPPAPGWAPAGHRLKAPLEYSRGPDKAWVYGGLRVRDGQAVTHTTRSRNTAGYRHLLDALDAPDPTGARVVLADNLSRHQSPPTRPGPADHPRVDAVFLPVGACWLNLVESWWRLLRQEAFAGQTFADADEIERAVQRATARLNRRARPWVWGRPAPTPRQRRRVFTYPL